MRTAAGLSRAIVMDRLQSQWHRLYEPDEADGLIGADTQAAIVKFERDRKLPVTGQMSDRLVRELSAMTGRPIE